MSVSPFLDWPPGEVLILASMSPRRAELLGVAGIPFEVVPAIGAETAPAAGARGLPPHSYARLLAEAKAAAVSEAHPGRMVLGADTVVVLDGAILEKPADDADARRMLGLLSGRKHTVITAMALIGGAARPAWIGHESTEVVFHDLDPESVRRYVASGEPADKAGAYGIQGLGALMVRRIEGCYFNVMGLPLALLGRALRAVLAGGEGPEE